MEVFMELTTIKVDIPEGCNIILGQTHFIKTTEDLYEIMTPTEPQAQFGIAFTEASVHASSVPRETTKAHCLQHQDSSIHRCRPCVLHLP